MYRASLRSSSAHLARAIRQPAVSGGARRLASTATPAASRGTWKGSAARWGLAAGALYWYNTSPIFADEATRHALSAPSPEAAPQEAAFHTVDALLEEKQKQEAAQKAAAAAAEASKKKAEKADAAAAAAAAAPPPGEGPALGAGSPEALEEEASQQGAFNPETGEINWDCPCLGGMADGPCGEDFKAAFSCFVYSAEEPKGMDCIDKFQHMQDCFRQYPEIYGAELADDEQDGEVGPGQQQPGAVEGVAAGVAASESSESSDVKASSSSSSETAPEAQREVKAEAKIDAKTDATVSAAESQSSSESTPAAPAPAEAAKDDVVQADVDRVEEAAEASAAVHVPKAAFDATNANKSA